MANSTSLAADGEKVVTRGKCEDCPGRSNPNCCWNWDRSPRGEQTQEDFWGWPEEVHRLMNKNPVKRLFERIVRARMPGKEVKEMQEISDRRFNALCDDVKVYLMAPPRVALSAVEIAEGLDEAEGLVREALSALVQDGSVCQSGSGKDALWYVL